MSTEQNKKTVQAFYDASNRGDMETCMSLIADDIIWQNIGTTPLSGRFEGVEELQEKLLGPLFGRLQAGINTRIIRLVAEGDYVVAQTQGTAQTVDGKPYNNQYCWIIRLRAGQFVEVNEYMDTELITRAFS